ncbi:hypothetical protein L209DRAFT_757048 [Thermothelomyces heterothallicus CBS 203.75]
MCESALGASVFFFPPARTRVTVRQVDDIPCSPILKSSYESQPTTPPWSRLQHHLITPEMTYSRVSVLKAARGRAIGAWSYHWLCHP